MKKLNTECENIGDWGRLYCGDCIEVMRTLPKNSVDTICCDPPYGLEFMGVAWDTMREAGKPRVRNEMGDFGSREYARHPLEWARIQRNKGLAYYKFSINWAKEALRVAKPGAFLLAFGGTRTFHRLACAIEDAGWEIRDCLMWLYGSGFPKSLNINKAVGKLDPTNFDWEGFGTALKPSWEPIIVAMKPLDGTFAENALKYGVAGLAIDKSRIGKKLGDRTEYGVNGIERKTGNVYGKQYGKIQFDGT